MMLDRLREAVILALEQLRANKFRSTLTILGVVVGVATVMAMSALITGFRSSVLEGFEAAGPKNFVISRFNFTEVRITDDGSRPAWMDNRAITIAEAKRIAALDEVRTAILDIDLSAEMDAGREHVDNVQISADGVGWSEFTPGTFTAGHDFLPADVRASRPVIVLSRALAETLYGSLDPIGRTVRVRGVPFRVVGVFEPKGNIFANAIKHFAILPYTAAIKHLSVNVNWFDLLVVTADHATQEQAIDRVIALLRTSRGLRPSDPNNFEIIRQEEMIKMFNRITGVFFLVMIILSSVGLMVGGVGVIAIMMISVTERTREIGVRKALGATRREILWQFLIEAATVTLTGGALGMLIGASLAFLVQVTTSIPAVVPVWAIAAALFMAAVAGVLFGLLPAWRAARLDPVVALRYE